MSAVRGVYLAYPLDQAPMASMASMYERVDHMKRMLVETGTASWVFDPGDAFMVDASAEVDDSLPRINRAAAIAADVVVAFLPRGVPTVGVPMEIDRAWSQGKHIVIFSDAGESWMLQYPNQGNGRIYRRDDWDIDDLMSAVEWLSNVDLLPTSKQFEDMPVLLDKGGQMPKRTYDDDAGLDLYTSDRVIIGPGEFADVPCGLSLELPYGRWGLVTGRSSALRRKGLLVHSGVIDAGYRGPIFAGAFNLTQDDVLIEPGERIAQLIIMSNATRYVTPVPVDALTTTARGKKGFGSSGA